MTKFMLKLEIESWHMDGSSDTFPRDSNDYCMTPFIMVDTEDLVSIEVSAQYKGYYRIRINGNYTTRRDGWVNDDRTETKPYILEEL